MIKPTKKDNSARVCYTFESNLEKVPIKEKKADGDVSIKILDQMKNIDLIVKQDHSFIIDRDARLLYKIYRSEFKSVTGLFNKEYFGCVETPESCDVVCVYGDDGVGKDSSIIVKMIGVKVS